MRGRFLHRQPPPGSEVDHQHPLGHGCVGWWEANVGSGLVVPDISGRDNHGAMTNMDPATDWVPGEHGGEWALDFDGLNDYVNCGESDVFDLDAGISLAAWVKTSDTGIWQDIASKTSPGAGNYEGYYINITNTNLARFNAVDGSGAP